MTEYVKFVRHPHNCTYLPNPYQNARTVVFLVRKQHASRFPKKGINWASMHSADFVFADGVLIKNIFGPTLRNPSSTDNQD